MGFLSYDLVSDQTHNLSKLCHQGKSVLLTIALSTEFIYIRQVLKEFF